MSIVILAENSIDPSTWKTYEADNICEFLANKFDTFPETARIYHRQVAVNCDVTPTDENSIKALQELEGVFYVIVYPGASIGTAIYYIVVAIIAIAAYVYARSLSAPTAAERNVQAESPNNELSGRQNKARPNGRIPDIFGTVRSTPDLLSVPYKVFENHQEVEYTYMCVGRGEYEIDANEVKDDVTKISDIAGTSVEIYGPNTSPNSGDLPQLSIGTPIGEPLYSTKRSNSVNGQVLEPSNIGTYNGSNDIKFKYPDQIIVDTASGVDFTDYFKPNDTLTVTNAAYDDTITFVNLSDVYTILSVSSSIIVLANPAAINTDWLALPDFTNDETGFISPDLVTSGLKWVGPFVFDITDLEQVFCNFVALNGLYKDNGVEQSRVDIEIELELTPINTAGNPIGPAETFRNIIEGSATTKTSRALTIKANPTFTGLCQFQARRITNRDLTFNGNIVDEVKWKDAYAVSPVTENDFGNITTVHSVTFATAGALSIKNRKLNMLVTRKIPKRISGNNFTTELYATNRVDEILSAVCLDKYIGNRSKSEIDFDNIYNTVAEIETYFGIENAIEFNYTFDSANLSFEETAAAIASAIHCKAYRQGNVLKLNFEKETTDSILLFNHRNKLPNSEKRTIRFGNQNDNDGVEFEYVSDEDDSILTIYLPEDKSAINPKKIESVGIRGKLQAYWHAWRIWNKIRYQNVATEFEATQEADLLVINDRILVADNTRPETQDGDVTSQNGLELVLSQPYIFDTGKNYTIYLQHIDGTVEAIGVTAGSDNYTVVLANPPKAALSLDSNAFARATYQIVENSSTREQAFLLTEKEYQSNLTSKLVGINYSDKYYENDKDYINGSIDANGILMYTVSGTVTGDVKENVLISLSNGKTALTDVNGNYTINKVYAGNYTIIPSKNDYNFAPTSKNISVVSNNIVVGNFVSSAIVYPLTYEYVPSSFAIQPATCEYSPSSFSNYPLTYEYKPISFEVQPTTCEYGNVLFDHYPSAAIPISDAFDGIDDNSGSYNDSKWFPRWSWDQGAGDIGTIVVGSGKVSLSANGNFSEIVINPDTFVSFDSDLEAIVTFQNLSIPTANFEFFFRIVTQAGGINFAEASMINDNGTLKWATNINGVSNKGNDSNSAGTLKILRTVNNQNDDWEIFINGISRATASTPIGDSITNLVWGFGNVGTGEGSVDVTDISVKNGIGGININVDGS